MEAVYGWVKNIIYYMIFLSVVNNLLADSKYGKYIRFFSGMVLILLVVSPFTGGLHLDEQISSILPLSGGQFPYAAPYNCWPTDRLWPQEHSSRKMQ